MGCGCKNDVNDSVSESTLNTKKNFLQKVGYFFNNRETFSIVGFIGSFIFIPVAITMAIPILSVAIFTKFTFNKDLDLVKLIVFIKDKKTKK